MSRTMLRFAIAALMPVPLIALGALVGGLWGLVAFLYITVFTAVVDRLITRILPAEMGEEFPFADGLSATLAVAHLLLLPLVLWALCGTALGAAQKIALFNAAALFMGQVSNANAHELIHRRRRWLRRLGVAVYVSVLYGHHASAHPLVHHRHVATDLDPNSAPLGMGFWRFAPRAWIGSFRAGYRAERLRGRNPYPLYVGGALAALAITASRLGTPGVAWYLGLASWVTLQLILVDYIQHYGLRRRIGADGRPEPVSPYHSWDAPHVWSSSLMLNAPRHSDHHSHPMRPYPALRLPSQENRMPYPVPIMGMLALWPRRWRRIMDKRARALSRNQVQPAI